MKNFHQEAADIAHHHAQVIDLMTAFETLRPDWSGRAFAGQPDAEACWCRAEAAWGSHFIILEHLFAATLPQTPTTARITLFAAAEAFIRDLEGQLEPGLLEAGQQAVALARQLADMPPVI